MGKENGAIHRYTDLPGLLHTLQKKRLTLLNPEARDDRNDSYFLSLYKRAKGLSCLAALCFSEADETYHHWKVFAAGAAGVRITFERLKLLTVVSAIKEIRNSKIEYRRINELRSTPANISELPFVKRYPYENEDEYRLIYESTTAPQAAVDIDLPLATIRRITLSPWMNKSVSDSVKQVIKSIPGCTKMTVSRSTLIGNDDWMAYGDAAFEAHKLAATTLKPATPSNVNFN